MPRLEFSQTFAEDLASITSPRIEANVLRALDDIEQFGDFGSPTVPEPIKRRYGSGVRKAVVKPFDLIYTHIPEDGVVRAEALAYGRSVS